MITTKYFGKTAEGKSVLAFTLWDGDRSVTILNYGGIVQSIIVPDRDGRLTDVALGYPDVAGYEQNGGYLGALIGRFGNRIGGGKLNVDGVDYQLACNDRGNHLHGGKVGFNRKIWAHGVVGDTLALSIVSPDGEENYPGTLRVTVLYTFRNRTLTIRYRATTDKKTVVNLTNHTYFNLNGEGGGTVLSHILGIESDRITPTNETMIPEGLFRDVEGTPFDFRTPKAIGHEIGADDIDLKQGNGYDHCFVLHNEGRLERYATVTAPGTGITMNCYTDAPAVQFYSGNGLHQQGKGGYYGCRAGFCLETQAIPNNPNVPAYQLLGSSYLAPGEVYLTTSSYEFKV